jgi:hypothetical protein
MGRRNPIRPPLGVAGLVTLALLLPAADAFGQAAVDQYIPSANPGSQHGSAAESVQQATQSTTTPTAPSKGKAKRANGTPAAGSAGGSGPPDSGGGGYPLTAFVIVVALLFIAGVAARYLPGLIRRTRARPTS